MGVVWISRGGKGRGVEGRTTLFQLASISKSRVSGVEHSQEYEGGSPQGVLYDTRHDKTPPNPDCWGGVWRGEWRMED